MQNEDSFLVTKFSKINKNKNKIGFNNLIPKNKNNQTESGFNRTSSFNGETRFLITENPFTMSNNNININSNKMEINPYNNYDLKYVDSLPQPTSIYNLTDINTIEVTKNIILNDPKNLTESNLITNNNINDINNNDDNQNNKLSIQISEASNKDQQQNSIEFKDTVQKMVNNLFDSIKDSTINLKKEYEDKEELTNNIVTENDHFCNSPFNQNKSIEINDYFNSHRASSLKSSSDKKSKTKKEEIILNENENHNLKRYNTNSHLLTKNW